jgi:ribosomal protein L37E
VGFVFMATRSLGQKNLSHTMLRCQRLGRTDFFAMAEGHQGSKQGPYHINLVKVWRKSKEMSGFVCEREQLGGNWHDIA